ncbi:hypothetical protein [Streptomyces sp. TRM72054]|uniref:hypothetical protein n=1 Tax=Streptomyces sp. TRM72054 TaxID=2870562 RepID=UPI001C8B3ED1|nr:hypothetical protein [Streptomyces sp. TRM72054]
MVRLTGMVPAQLHAQAYANTKAAGITMGLFLKRLVEQLAFRCTPTWRQVGGRHALVGTRGP